MAYRLDRSLARALVTGASLLTLSLAAATARADVVTWNYEFTDSYRGCQYNGTGCGSYSDDDVIGDAGKFGISKAGVQRNAAGDLTVSIHTNFAANDSAIGSFAGNTKNGKGIGYGDLFLSNTPYTPAGGAVDTGSDGEPADPVASQADHAGNGHQWTFALVFDDRYNESTDTGTVSLYKLDAADYLDNVLLSDDFMSGAIYRNGHEVAVNTANATLVEQNAGTWTATSGVLTFTMAGGTSVLIDGWDGLALKWSMLCANDSIEGWGNNRVPEPGALVLLATGLFASLGMRRRRGQRAA